ncbi:MAG: site-2 protease family protein, partial [Ignavibacteriales bacterium]|nr:site-2 protease family protein [Ignavibacteriales bacterium]
LPYFIPAPPFLINPFGTLGAVIRMRSEWSTKKALFDIGIAGPLSGLIVTLTILLFGFFTLPPKEYIFTIHPEYKLLNNIPSQGFTLGNSLLFAGLTTLFNKNSFVPPLNEIYHYPYLCVGWFGLFVTALNLMPFGQLDGGHILYTITDRKKQGIIARIFFVFLIIIGLISVILFLTSSYYLGSMGWLLWALILYFLIKLDHPEIHDNTSLSRNRKLLGWIMFTFFILTFPPIPFSDSIYTP